MLQGLPEKSLMRHVEGLPHRLVFATISGAHLYGFESSDSDFDIRGVHVLPLENVIGLLDREETIEKEGIYDGLEIDLVTHDLEKFIRLMLRRNGYVLEQVLSPLVLRTSEVHDELVALSAGCITKHHAHHYLGFAASQWRLFCGGSKRVKGDSDNANADSIRFNSAKRAKALRVKPLLYCFRTLLTGIHLMQTGEVEANLLVLNSASGRSYLDDLVHAKRTGGEKDPLNLGACGVSIEFLTDEYLGLRRALEAACDASHLADEPSSRDALNDLLVRQRLATGIP